MKKNFIIYTLVLFMVLSICNPREIFANDNILYTDKKRETITSGLVYEYSERLYKTGWKDIHVLMADINNPNIEVDILQSKEEHGLKENVEALVEENGAIAGINADFFGAGNPFSSMGQVLRDGNVAEAQNYYNGSANKYAGFFIDKYGRAFIDYLKSNMRIYNKKGTILEIQGKNKITTFSKPMYFDNTLIKNTKDLDKRRKDLFKIVVKDGVVIKKVTAGETVDIPENGFIIVMNKKSAEENLHLFNIGDAIGFNETYKFLFREGKKIQEIKKGISAGGEILRNGAINTNGMSISPQSKNPRSAIGINKNKDKIILIAVDGRGRSVGATHNEMAELMLEYGAYDAIHLDGGGSTTMAIRNVKKNDIEVVNNVSDGKQRLVPNAIGIKATQPTQDAISLKLSIDKKDNEAIIAQEKYKINAYGIDKNQNLMNINVNDVSFKFKNENDGAIINNEIIINKAGNVTILAEHKNGAKGEITLNVKEPFIYLDINIGKTSLFVDDFTNIWVTAVNKDGFSRGLDIKDISLSVLDNSIGNIENGKFVAKKEGVTSIVAKYNGATSSITIAVGNSKVLVESFELPKTMSMLYFPKDKGVSGGAGLVDSIAFDGANSLLLSYSFKGNSDTPQASYVSFEKSPIMINSQSNYIEMQVKGDGSQNILKAVIKDKNNKQYIVPILNDLTSTDWVTASMQVPKEVAYPIRIDKLYVASLSTAEEETGTIYIDGITEIKNRLGGGYVNNGYIDYLNRPIMDSDIKKGDEDINVFGQTAIRPYKDSEKVLVDAIQKMSKNVRAMVFAGDTNINGISLNGAVGVVWDNKYKTTNTSNISIINLATKNGNMRIESPNQWRWLQSYLENQSKNNILINMDKNIWDKKESLIGARENVLLHKILKEFVEKTGKNIIVVSAVSDGTSINVKDGVRYITLNGLSSPNEGLNNYKYLAIRASNDSLSYEIKSVY